MPARPDAPARPPAAREDAVTRQAPAVCRKSPAGGEQGGGTALWSTKGVDAPPLYPKEGTHPVVPAHEKTAVLADKAAPLCLRGQACVRAWPWLRAECEAAPAAAPASNASHVRPQASFTRPRARRARACLLQLREACSLRVLAHVCVVRSVKPYTWACAACAPVHCDEAAPVVLILFRLFFAAAASVFSLFFCFCSC